MKHSTIPPFVGKMLLRTACCLLICSIFTTHTAWAQTISDWTDLNTALTSASSGTPVTLDSGHTISVGNTENAIVIDAEDLTLKGATASNFDTTITNLSLQFGTMADTVLTSKDSTNLLNNYRSLINGWAYSGSISSLSGISGNNGTRGPVTTPVAGENNKWLTTPSGTPSAANGLNLQDVHFHNVKVEYEGERYVNGLIGNNHNASGTTSLGNLAGNAFTKIEITHKSNTAGATDYLAGGGVIGVRSTAGNAEMGEVTGNIFDGIKIMTTDHTETSFAAATATTSAYLEGGGLVGVNAVSSPGNVVGHARMEELSNNFFTGIKILSNDVLLGGGLVGLNNNSKHSDPSTTYALLNDAVGNIFGNGNDGDITIQVGYSLRGGGVIGLNGLSDAEVRLNTLENNAFAGISVETGTYLKGGGIVGLQTNDGGTVDKPTGDHYFTDTMNAAAAILENASNNLFLNQQIKIGTHMEGGGVIGLRSNEGAAFLETLEGNVFKKIDVEVGGDASGGGIVGVSSVMVALLGTAESNYFNDLTVKVTDDLEGGGFIGVHARNTNGQFSLALIENIVDNTFVGAQLVTDRVEAYWIRGGGIIGAANATGLAAVDNVTGNHFENLTIDTVYDLVGGGVLGVWAEEGEWAPGDVYAIALIENISNNTFTNVSIEVDRDLISGGGTGIGGILEGGGIIGVRADTVAGIRDVIGNEFSNNYVHAYYINGGGIIGVTGRGYDENDPENHVVALLNRIESSTFTGNTVRGDGVVKGGIVYSYGLSEGMIIRDSEFLDNTLTSNWSVVFGTVTIDTSVPVTAFVCDPLDPHNPDEWHFVPDPNSAHTVTLTATDGNHTVFDGNTIDDWSLYYFPDLQNIDGSRTNSLYFGTIAHDDDGGEAPGNRPPPMGGPAQSPAKLIVDPKEGGVVALYDPIWVHQSDPNDPSNNHTFSMDVTGAGHFIWGGTNVFDIDEDVSDTVTLYSGSTTTILDGSSTTTNLNDGSLLTRLGQSIPLKLRHTMSLIAPNFTFHLNDGARLNVEGHNVFDLSGYHDAPGAPVANLNGHLHFNLNNTRVYAQGDVPAAVSSGLDQPLLTIVVPANGQGMVDLKDSTVTLSDFAPGRTLHEGDRFYLIELVNGRTDDANRAFTEDFQFVEGGAPYVTTARQGTSLLYDFIIDQNGENYGNDENTRFLVARLRGIRVSDDFDAPNNGRITEITFLQRGSDQLIDIPLYDFDSAPTNDPCAAVGHRSGWVRAPFAEVKGTWYRTNSSSVSHSDVRGALFLGGLTVQKRLHNGRIHLGTFIDAGDAKYGTYNDFSRSPTSAYSVVRGSGDIDYLGGGVLLRRKWNNGFQLDTVFRGGNMKEKFYSSDLRINDRPTRFRLENTYWGADLGMGYVWQKQRKTFEVYSRYSWLMAEGGTVLLSANENVTFDTLYSHRLITGGRLTKKRNALLSWFAGAAYEQEFDGASHAVEQHSGNYLVLGNLNLRGGTGIGELGLILNQDRRFYFTSGVEGYVGTREGGSVFLAATWQW